MKASGADDELVQDYLAECREHLATIETDLLAIESNASNIDDQLLNHVFRAAHSIKGGRRGVLRIIEDPRTRSQD